MRLRLEAFSRYRPRVLTLVLMAAIAAVLVLANLSADVGGANVTAAYVEYGWPLIWRRYVVGLAGGSALDHVRVGRLTGNVAMWLFMLAAPGIACEWLMRRYRPRLRWSLRTMLGAVGLVAAFFAWCASIHDRAEMQDQLIADFDARGSAVIEMENWGPKWFSLIVAERYLRRINYARVYDAGPHAELLKRLGRSPDLRYLELWLNEWTPEVAAAISDMPHVRKLRILLRKSEHYLRNYDDDRVPHEWLAAIGKLKGLEKLDLEWSVISDDSLPYLADLTSLKTLYWTDHIRWVERVDFDSRRSLARLPQLPQLETIDFTGALVGDHDVRQLAVLPRLKSLNLSETFVTAAGLAELASLGSLEELAIDQGIITASGLESLLALKRLRALHIIDDSGHAVHWGEMKRLGASRTCFSSIGSETDLRGPLILDDGHEMFIREYEIDRCRSALQRLRRSNPGIVIDSDGEAFDRRKKF